MSYELPVELFDEIFSHLFDDHESLKACSVVSRIMTGPSQKHLFSMIVLRNSGIGKYNPPIHGGTSSDFLRLLSTSPHIATYVECLQLIDQAYFKPGYEYWIPQDASLPHCLSHLRNLKALVIYGMRWKDISEDVFSALFTLLKLPSLIYLDVTPHAPKIFAQTSCDLKHLLLRYSTADDLPLPNPPTPDPIYLESLCISQPGRFVSSFTKEPNSRIRTNQLRNLTVGSNIYTDQEYYAVWTLLQSCSHTLQNLQLMQVFRKQNSMLEQTGGLINFGELTALKSLALYLNFASGDYHDPIRWLNISLRSCSSPVKRLEELTVSITCPSSSHIDAENWNDVCKTLLNDNFSCLKRLNIYITPKNEYRAIFDMLSTSDGVAKLRVLRDLEVNITVKLALFCFAPNPLWECIRFRWDS